MLFWKGFNRQLLVFVCRIRNAEIPKCVMNRCRNLFKGYLISAGNDDAKCVE